MYAYVIRRILATVPVVAVVTIFIFLLLHLTPGDPAAVIAGEYATPDAIEKIRARLGLDQPAYIQFFKWVGALAQGDLGVSVFSNLPVAELIRQRLEPTLFLALITICLAIVIAVPLGTLAAWRAGSWIDRAIMIFTVLGFSVPAFVVGYLLMFAFAIKFNWLPVQGYTPIAEGFWAFLQSLILPSITLGTVYTALIARITRASVMDVLDEDYIRTAHAKGLAPRTVLMRHALKNAAIPIVTVIGVGIALLIGGVAITESVFNIPGLGRLTVDAVLHRDYPVIQGVILIFAAIYVIINLLIDLSYTYFDPRIRY